MYWNTANLQCCVTCRCAAKLHIYWIVRKVHVGFSITSYKKPEQTFGWPNTYIHSLFRFFSRFRVLSRVSCAIQHVIFSYLFYIDNSSDSSCLAFKAQWSHLSSVPHDLLAKSSPSQCVEPTPWELPQKPQLFEFPCSQITPQNWVSFQLCTNELWLGCSLHLLSPYIYTSWDRLSGGPVSCVLLLSPFALLTPPCCPHVRLFLLF